LANCKDAIGLICHCHLNASGPYVSMVDNDLQWHSLHNSFHEKLFKGFWEDG